MQNHITTFLPIRERHCKLQADNTGVYVNTFNAKWYATAPVHWRTGLRVLVRFDVPGSNVVSVWRGDQFVGDFRRR